MNHLALARGIDKMFQLDSLSPRSAPFHVGPPSLQTPPMTTTVAILRLKSGTGGELEFLI